MAYIGQRPVIGRYIKLDQISSGFNGSNTGFSMTAGSQAVFPGTARNLLLSLGGVIQEPDTDFTISGSTLTFTTPPVANTTFFGVIYGDMQATGTPSDGTVLPASIASSGNFSFPQLTVTSSASLLGGAVFNENGADVDFRVESDINTHAIFLNAGNSRVGINTASPSDALHVTGNISVTSGDVLITDANPSVRFTDTDAPTGFGHVGVNNTSGSLVLRSDDGNALSGTFMGFEIDGSPKMTLDGTGLGIGTSSPSTALHINMGSGGLPKIRLQHTSAGNDVFEITGGLAGVSNGGFGIYDVDESAYRLAIDSSGNVGIGDTSPGAKLEVASADSTYALKLTCSENVSGSYNGLSIAGADENAGSYPLVVVSNSTTHESGGHPILCCTQRKVGIGTLSPNSSLNIHGVFETNAFDSAGGNGGRTTTGLLIGDAFTAGKSGTSDDRNAIIWQERGLDINFATNDTVRMTLDHDGNLGIGTNNPDTPLHVERATTGDVLKGLSTNNNTRSRITLQGKDPSGNAVTLMLGGDGDFGGMVFTHSNHALGFATNNAAPQMKLKTSGHLRLTSGNLEFASGAGIDFSAVSDGSRSVITDGNKFDDYEEGTFTPTLTCQNSLLTASYVNQDGNYTKIGRMVYFQIYIRLSAKSGGSGQLRVSNLPFTSSATSGAAYGGAYAAYTFNWDNDALDRMMIGSGSNQIQCFIGTSSGTNVNAGAGNLNSDTQMRILGSYHV